MANVRKQRMRQACCGMCACQEAYTVMLIGVALSVDDFSVTVALGTFAHCLPTERHTFKCVDTGWLLTQRNNN